MKYTRIFQNLVFGGLIIYLLLEVEFAEGVLAGILVVLCSIVFVVLADIDLRKMYIPVFPLAFCGVLGIAYFLIRAFEFRDVDLAWLSISILPIIVFFVASRYYKEQVVGVGDYLIFIVLGLFLNFEQLLIAFEVAIVVAAVVGILYSIIYKKPINEALIPLVPFLTFGFLVSLNFEKEIIGVFN